MVKVFIGWISVGLLTLGLAQDAPPQKSVVSFNKDVVPILKAACTSCHGTNGSGNLNLVSPAAISKSKTIIKGDPVKSDLIRRIKGLDGKPQMPMGFKPLTPAQVKVLEDWITAGAVIDAANAKHWSYEAPVEPKIPVTQSKWVKTPVDNFVLEKMVQQGYKPSPAASKETLARRVYLDLVGLPPTVEELDEFLTDSRPNSYERLVDKLLASPRYGERQARIWLDLARYADSHGYEKDANRVAWPFRDWVIKAYNTNMPFDQFTIDQLAGDMLPKPTQDQLVATGFHRNTMLNEEGGVEPAEAFYNTIIDRVGTTSTVWLGSTLQCARCHDHKFDPFSQKDFYKMYAIFGNVKYSRAGDYEKSAHERWVEPSIRIETEDYIAQHTLLKKKHAKLEQDRKKLAEDDPDRRRDWNLAITQPVDWTPAEATSLTSQNGTALKQLRSFEILASGPNPEKEVYTITAPVPKEGISGLRIEALVEGDLGSGRADSQNFILTDVRISLDGKQKPFALGRADFVQDSYSVPELIKGNKASGWAVSPHQKKNHEIVLSLHEPVKAEEMKITLSFESTWAGHNLRRFLVSSTSHSFPVVHLMDRSKIEEIDWLVSDPRFLKINGELEKAHKEMRNWENSAPSAMVLSEKKATTPLTTMLYRRGEFSMPQEKVEAGTPGVLPPIKESPNRLTLAKWLVDPKNPLTARVQVNRIWEQYFGRGLVNTPEDFGTQGAPPSHRKLLDWLATYYVKTGWDNKKLHKLIVTSAVYQQSSSIPKTLQDRDPNNVYLARGPRYRMEAEMIRDSALRISGLLSPKIGGPSVMPYQPQGVWDTPYNGQQWMQEKDDQNFRRGIYVFAKRTAMYPSFMAFDATSREVCNVTRGRTNTPLQALTLLNDQVYLDAAKSLGNKMASSKDGLVRGFRMATSRVPTPKEVDILRQTLNTFRKRFKDRPEEAKKLGTTPEGASWTMVGNVLLNLDETITKG